MKVQRGFTLLELMVAMAIFAVLAVAGWQVFDGVSRARENAQAHADHLAVLQYAYLQLQQDMAQMVPYQRSVPQKAMTTITNNGIQASETDSEPLMTVNGEQVGFVRFADPDPRYQRSPSLQRIDYVFTDGRLIRRQYMGIQGSADRVSLDSTLLENVSMGRWQAYLPKISDTFPNKDINNQIAETPQVLLLPKGVGVSFTYQNIPITWQWALVPQALPRRNQGALKDEKSGERNDGSVKDNLALDSGPLTVGSTSALATLPIRQP